MRSTARSRRIQTVCGDRVTLLADADGRAIVNEVLPRRTIFARSSAYRTKLLAANITQIVIVVACEPTFSDDLICRLLIAAERASLAAILVLNKIDLADRIDSARARLEPFRQPGYTILELAGRHDASLLRTALRGHRSLLIGQSGMGKSTLVKTLVPDAEVTIREISHFLDAGRQSTTASRLFSLDDETELVDTPGVSDFGLSGLDTHEIAAGFREFSGLTARCRFQDCRHMDEPGCAVGVAVRDGQIHRRRLELFRQIVKQESQVR